MPIPVVCDPDVPHVPKVLVRFCPSKSQVSAATGTGTDGQELE